jgi:hypothetical protein
VGIREFKVSTATWSREATDRVSRLHDNALRNVRPQFIGYLN